MFRSFFSSDPRDPFGSDPFVDAVFSSFLRETPLQRLHSQLRGNNSRSQGYQGAYRTTGPVIEELDDVPSAAQASALRPPVIVEYHSDDEEWGRTRTMNGEPSQRADWGAGELRGRGEPQRMHTAPVSHSPGPDQQPLLQRKQSAIRGEAQQPQPQQQQQQQQGGRNVAAVPVGMPPPQRGNSASAASASGSPGQQRHAGLLHQLWLGLIAPFHWCLGQCMGSEEIVH